MSVHRNIQVRAVEDNHVSFVDDETFALRVANDIGSTSGTADCATYEADGRVIVAKISRTRLADCQPGEAVLIEARNLQGPDDGFFRLCQVLGDFAK
jgi:hypothetical protein